LPAVEALPDVKPDCCGKVPLQEQLKQGLKNHHQDLLAQGKTPPRTIIGYDIPPNPATVRMGEIARKITEDAKRTTETRSLKK
jgi:hypothetical protein